MQDDNSQSSRRLLSSEDSEKAHAANDTDLRSRVRRPQFIFLCIVLEIAHFLLVWSIHEGLRRTKSPELSDIDGLQKLKEFNVLKVFNNDNKWTEDTDFANEFWMHELMPKSAILSLDAQWAASQGIPPSAPTPGRPNEMVYQTDVFHSLHCLYRIRHRLLSNESHPHDGHMLHCLNYLRQSFQCNPDLMFGTTKTYEDYGLYDTHVCRDYDAILRWVDAHRWVGFWEWNSNGAKGSKVDQNLVDPDTIGK